MIDDREPLCRKDPDKRDPSDLIKDSKERDMGTGVRRRVERFRDGSEIVHFGGPCGSVHFDKYGEEC